MVTANDANGSSTQTAESTYTPITNTAPVNSVVPAVTGTTTVGNALAAGTGTWSDTDSDTLTYSYQWYRATDSRRHRRHRDQRRHFRQLHADDSADANKYVRVVVTANDANGSSTQTANRPTPSIANSAPVNTVAPAVTGTASVGKALTADTGTWSNADTDVTYTYQWYRSTDSGGTNDAAITRRHLRELHADHGGCPQEPAGRGHRRELPGPDHRRPQPRSRTAVTNTVPVNTAAPAVTGTAPVGGTLSAGTGTWSDTDSDTLGYTYQWYRVRRQRRNQRDGHHRRDGSHIRAVDGGRAQVRPRRGHRQ